MQRSQIAVSFIFPICIAKNCKCSQLLIFLPPGPDLVFDDLDLVLGKFKHWAHRLYPKLPFNDVTDRIAVLGKKAGVKVYLQKVRSGMIDPEAQARMAAGGQGQVSDEEDNVAREGDLERLLGDLALHRLDLLITDRTIPPGTSVKAYNHPLGDSPVQFFAQKNVAYRYVRSFPDCLEGNPVLLPISGSPLRRSLEEFFDRKGVVPKVVAEFDDSALLKAFGEAGAGFFPAPAAIADQVEHMYHAKSIGDVDGVTEHFYAISPERKIKHPAVVRITEVAREQLGG